MEKSEELLQSFNLHGVLLQESIQPRADDDAEGQLLLITSKLVIFLEKYVSFLLYQRTEFHFFKMHLFILIKA